MANKQVGLRLDKDHVDMIDIFAKKRGISRCEWIRQALIKKVNQSKGE